MNNYKESTDNVGKMIEFLTKCQEAYHKGRPLISDEEFDVLAEKYNFYEVGAMPTGIKKSHLYRMYSLQKVYEEDNPSFPQETIVQTPKLDGSAISLLYVDGILVLALTRGDGIVGEDITDKIVSAALVPITIPKEGAIQITGEIVAKKTIENPRNYVSGALHLKDLEQFLSRELTFVAYGIQPYMSDSYMADMTWLKHIDFNTVTMGTWEEYPQDGKVARIDSNESYEKMGYTAKHPRAAWAIKRRADVAIIPTVLREVVWQLGKGGKVTPVAKFDEIVIEDAKITRATLHNAGFVEEWDFHIGDRILITRSGGIIPKVVGKE